MKKMKRILALALSLVMIMGMSMTTFATESNDPVFAGGEKAASYALTISNPVTNHNYEVYQIFTGDVFDKEGTPVLSNIKYGESYGETSESLSDDDLERLETAVDEDDAITLAKYYISHLNDTGNAGAYKTLNTANPSEMVPSGYYLIKDKWAGPVDGENNPILGEDETLTFSAYMVSIVGATTFKPKTITVPTFEKTSENLEIVSDKKVGDSVDFELKAKLPSDLDFSNFESYTITFNDELSAGLDWDGTCQVWLGEGEDATLLNSNPAFNERTLKYDLEILESGIVNTETAPGAIFRLTYTAKINDDAIERTGEVNKATLDYTNNPDGSQGSTPGDDVKIFLAQLTINKKDGANNNSPLTGAGFTLFKYEGEETSFDPSDYTPDKVDVANAYRTAVVSNDEDGTVGSTFTFGGLEAGTYVLVETTTPNGYNTMESKLIKITFIANEDNGEVTEIIAETLNDSTDDVWACELQSNDTENTVYGTIMTDIVNNAGLELPSTGGIGTTIFYVIGGVMVLGACVLLITKRRMKSRG